MKIYTKRGDAGETSISGGIKVKKNDSCLQTNGAVDELSCFLGLAEAKTNDNEIKEVLLHLQNDLYLLASDVSNRALNETRITEQHVLDLEKFCDKFEEELDELRNFILPGGNEIASVLHVARATCRRAERETVELNEQGKIALIDLKYLNRLSDLLFLMARIANKRSGKKDVLTHH